MNEPERLVPPYKVIANGLANGTVIPFLGAGASLGCRVADPPPDTGDDPALPSSAQLSTRLAATTSFPQGVSPDLATVAQYFEVVSSRADLNGALREVFAREYQPSRLHRYLASIEGPLLIVTTNYDRLIETALGDRPYDVVVHTTDAAAGDLLLHWKHGAEQPERVLAKNLYIDLGTTTVIYKMHGAVDRVLAARDQYVITEDDYVNFLSRLLNETAVPSIFYEPLKTRRFLFLGYGLRDWNLRVVLNGVDASVRVSRASRSWAIDASPSALETRLWLARGVDIYRMTIEEFLDGLGAS